MGEVFRLHSLSRTGANFQEGKTTAAYIAPRVPMIQIAETLKWWQANLFDGRDVVTATRLIDQLVEHCVNQNLGSSVETFPFDALFHGRIVEFKRVNNNL
jgi:hypothetical protein